MASSFMCQGKVLSFGSGATEALYQHWIEHRIPHDHAVTELRRKTKQPVIWESATPEPPDRRPAKTCSTTMRSWCTSPYRICPSIIAACSPSAFWKTCRLKIAD